MKKASLYFVSLLVLAVSCDSHKHADSDKEKELLKKEIELLEKEKQLMKSEIAKAEKQSAESEDKQADNSETKPEAAMESNSAASQPVIHKKYGNPDMPRVSITAAGKDRIKFSIMIATQSCMMSNLEGYAFYDEKSRSWRGSNELGSYEFVTRDNGNKLKINAKVGQMGAPCWIPCSYDECDVVK